jgi:hypothetical protein
MWTVTLSCTERNVPPVSSVRVVDVSSVLCDLYGRVPELLHGAVDGLTPEQLRWAPDDEGNTIAWLAWHLTRVEDMYAAEYAGGDQLWTSGAWAGRFGLEPDPSNHGYGHTPADVRAVQPDSPAACIEYHAAVHAKLLGYLEGLSSTELDTVVDTNWDPPVTLGVRLVSIADDCLQHVGQAAYLRGLIDRQR